MSGPRFTATPPSVAPYASITSRPKRREKLATTSGEPFVAERDAQRVVGVVGVLGLREQVRERLARVVEVGRAVVADVGEPPRRGEPPAEPDRARRDDRRRPTDLHRVRVEQRHAHVADVVGAEVHDHRHALAGHEQPALRADDRLRRVGRARREDQRPDRVDVGLDPGIGRVRVRGERVGERRAERRRAGRPASAKRPDDRTGGSRSAIGCEQRLVPRLGDHEPAVACSTSRRRCSSRRVWLRPTTAAPISAAPPNAKR